MLAPGMAEPASQPHGGGKWLPEHAQAACAKEPAKFLEEGRGKQQQSGKAGSGNLAGKMVVAKVDQMGPKGISGGLGISRDAAAGSKASAGQEESVKSAGQC